MIWLPQTFPADRNSQPETGIGLARYRAEWNAKRWSDALSMERSAGRAVCDTDRLKLHYLWCLRQVGMASKEQWQLQLRTSRKAISEKRLGFADAYFVKTIDPVIARRQSDADLTRVRARFELHVRLQAPLMTRYALLDNVIGGRVRWTLPDDGLQLDTLCVHGCLHNFPTPRVPWAFWR